MIKEKLTLLAQVSNFAVWLGSGSLLALQFVNFGMLTFEPEAKLFISKYLSYIVVGCCTISGYKLAVYLNTSKQMLKDVVKREIEQENKDERKGDSNHD